MENVGTGETSSFSSRPLLFRSQLFGDYMKVGMRSFHSYKVDYSFRKYEICSRKFLWSLDLVTLPTEVRFIVAK